MYFTCGSPVALRRRLSAVLPLSRPQKPFTRPAILPNRSAAKFGELRHICQLERPGISTETGRLDKPNSLIHNRLLYSKVVMNITYAFKAWTDRST